jgi:hypothetical protein
MADECDDPRCGAIFPQGHLPGCRNSSRPPKGRSSWDATEADRDLYVAKVLWHKEVVLSLDVMQDRYPGSEALQ